MRTIEYRRLPLLLFVFILFAVNAAQSAELAIGATAPAFSLKGMDGKTVSMSDFTDSKGVLVVFSSSSCSFAKDYQGRLKALYNDYHAKGIVLVVIDASDSKTSPSEKAFPYPYLEDGAQTASKAYGTTNFPHAFLFNGAGKLVYRGRIDDNTEESKVKKRDLREAIDHLLAGTADKIEAPITKAFGCSYKPKSN